MPDYLNMSYFGQGALLMTVAAIILAAWGEYGFAVGAAGIALLGIVAAVLSVRR